LTLKREEIQDDLQEYKSHSFEVSSMQYLLSQYISTTIYIGSILYP